MRNFFVEGLSYGDERTVEIRGNYLKALARAVSGRNIADAEVVVMTDGSEESSEIRLLYVGNESMSGYVFSDVLSYINNTMEILDVVSFNYVCDGITKTGVVIVEKVVENELLTELSKEFK